MTANVGCTRCSAPVPVKNPKDCPHSDCPIDQLTGMPKPIRTLDASSLADELEAYFRSGNDVSVERATIPAELALRVVSVLRSKTLRVKELALLANNRLQKMEALERQLADLRHDMERGMANHNADLNSVKKP